MTGPRVVDVTLVDGHLANVRLTPREHDVLGVLADFYTNDEMAQILHIAPDTVKHHLKTIYLKLAVNSRGEAVRRARSLDLM